MTEYFKTLSSYSSRDRALKSVAFEIDSSNQSRLNSREAIPNYRLRNSVWYGSSEKSTKL